NAIQSTLDLLSGSNILITDNGDGSVTIDANLSASPITLDTSNTLLSSAITAGSVPLSTDSIFFGVDAGYASLSSDKAISIGYNAGYGASGSRYNFIGDSSGSGANNVIGSNFFGTSSGLGADNASYSNFFGNGAGMNATDASYSNLFGFRAGTTFGANNIGSNNIIIGTNISLPNATANSINFGGVLFGANTYSTTTGDPSIAAVMNGRIGIATIPTTYTLEVGNSSVAGVVAHFTNSTGYCDINPTTISLTCSSDSTLKKNITTIGDTLDSLLTLNPVTYNWNTESDTDDKHIGFIAQEVEQIYPDLVSTDQNGLKSLNYTGLIPYTIKAIQEINLNIIGIRDLTTENTWRDSLISWFADTANGIQSLVVHDEICIDGQCLTRDDIRFLLELKAVQQGGDIHDDTPNNDTPLETEQETPEETPASVEIQTETETPAEEPAVQEESIPTLEPTATPLEGTV
ncbi:tail fiber domain-containing protein, partial [Candidatus Nomurabacteria bacterium]|nr:tail fiber domain-containing protein [Candidatus Nomurabacteria bacterium]